MHPCCSAKTISSIDIGRIAGIMKLTSLKLTSLKLTSINVSDVLIGVK